MRAFTLIGPTTVFDKRLREAAAQFFFALAIVIQIVWVIAAALLIYWVIRKWIF